MTSKILILGAALIFAITTVFAQTDDQITYLRVDNQITSGNYDRALELLTTISAEGKKSSSYLSSIASCYEKSKKYDQAADSYKLLYQKTKSPDALKKIAEMKDLQDEQAKNEETKKNCQKCFGTGYKIESKTCTQCNGDGTISATCSKENVGDFFASRGRFCNGTGKCDMCGGTGTRILNMGSGRQEVGSCYCHDGKCMVCHGTGKVAILCPKCKGTKKMDETVICDHH
jgi:hypothetical protein